MQYVLLVLRYLPLVMELVTTVEKLTGDTLSGGEKKALVMQALNDSAAALPIAPKELDAISQMVDTVARLGNAFGVFGKSRKPEAQP